MKVMHVSAVVCSAVLGEVRGWLDLSRLNRPLSQGQPNGDAFGRPADPALNTPAATISTIRVVRVYQFWVSGPKTSTRLISSVA